MTLSHGFRRLANVLETLESNGVEVRDVATADDEPNHRLTVDLTVTVPIDADDSPTPASSADEADGATSDQFESDQTDSERSDSDRSKQSPAAVRGRVLDPLSVRADETNGASAIEPADAEADGDEEANGDEDTESTAGDADTAGDDAVDCPMADCDATFESDHGMKIHRTKVHGDDRDGSADGTPAYRDPDRLREVYAACDSFPEMRAALETDVSTQTVRRQMIAHDIYEPGESGSGAGSEAGDDGPDADESTDASATSDPAEGDVDASDGGPGEDRDEATAAEAGTAEPARDDADAEDEGGEEATARDDEPEEEAVADDELELDAVELPEGVTAADLQAGVSSAQTLYDVQQRFDLDRTEAMELLDTYDLLAVVHGRVSHRDRRKQVDEDEITRRILEHAPVEQPSRT